jgi:hypothetical protein
VPELAVSNPLDDDVLLYDGEELVGAKQNRILNVSVLVSAHSTLEVPMSCVEQGRWRTVSRSFSAAPHVSNTDLRRRKAAALATQALALGAAQGVVWDAVQAKLEALRPLADGGHRDAFVAHERTLGVLERAFAAEPGQCGAVLAIGDALCLDAVSRPDAFVALWPKLGRVICSTRSTGSTAGRHAPSASSASWTRSQTRVSPAGRPRASGSTSGSPGRGARVRPRARGRADPALGLHQRL